MRDCVFCNKVKELAKETEQLGPVWHFEPLNPVTPGHRLFVHEIHTDFASQNPNITGQAFEAAAKYAKIHEHFNLITSAGTEATQTVFHTHIHYVPRHENDGLHLPWTGQIK